jgi:hypothetical protein
VPKKVDILEGMHVIGWAATSTSIIVIIFI